jgi:hypothetical protein
MALGHIAGVPVEETLPGLVGPIAVYLAAGGVLFRRARKRLHGQEAKRAASRNPGK